MGARVRGVNPPDPTRAEQSDFMRRPQRFPQVALAGRSGAGFAAGSYGTYVQTSKKIENCRQPIVFARGRYILGTRKNRIAPMTETSRAPANAEQDVRENG